MTENTPDFRLTFEKLLRDRIDSPIDGSYTSELIAASQKRGARTVSEEAVELALASISGDRRETIDEAADLPYQVLVTLNSQRAERVGVVARLA